MKLLFFINVGFLFALLQIVLSQSAFAEEDGSTVKDEIPINNEAPVNVGSEGQVDGNNEGSSNETSFLSQEKVQASLQFLRKVGEKLKPDYVGGGLSINEVKARGVEGEASGFHAYAGYNIPKKYIDMSAIKFGKETYDLSWILLNGELGTGSTGDVEVDLPTRGTRNVSSLSGLWAAMIFEMPLAKEFSVLPRLGVDFGDDDGWIIGLGGQYNVNSDVGVRVEYVSRDRTKGVHFNAVFSL